MNDSQASADPTPPPSLSSPNHTNNTTASNTPASTPNSNMMSVQNNTSSIGKSNSGTNQSDRATPISRSLNMPSQMTALESAAQERDEDSQSPGENNSIKGKCDIKQEHDIKTEADDDANMMDTNSNNSNSNCGGKNVNNDMSSGIKTEIKGDPMDQGDNNSAESDNEEMNECKDEIKDEPMSPSDEKPKIEKKSTIPEPIEQDGNEKDKKKKCRKYLAVESRRVFKLELLLKKLK